jgi:hypothetical protein
LVGSPPTEPSIADDKPSREAERSSDEKNAEVLIAFVAVYVLLEVCNFLVHGLWLRPTYASLAGVWRPAAEVQARSGSAASTQSAPRSINLTLASASGALPIIGTVE